MTKKQAVREAAMCGSICVFTIGELEEEYRKVAECAYDLGRIAGLREAAKIVDPPPDSPCVGAKEYGIAADWLREAAVQLRERAARMAKKARTK